MRALLLVFLSSLAVFGADTSSWAKVRELKSGTELRIYQRGSRQPLLANFDEATDDKLLVATKKEQKAIPKEEIDRIDYRPPQTGSRVTRETKTRTTDPATNTQPPPAGVPAGAQVPTTSQSSSLTFGSKPDFETIYRRMPTAKD